MPDVSGIFIAQTRHEGAFVARRHRLISRLSIPGTQAAVSRRSHYHIVRAQLAESTQPYLPIQTRQEVAIVMGALGMAWVFGGFGGVHSLTATSFVWSAKIFRHSEWLSVIS